MSTFSRTSSTKNNLAKPRPQGFSVTVLFFWRYPVQLTSRYEILETSPIYAQPSWLGYEFEALAEGNEPIRNVVNVKKGLI